VPRVGARNHVRKVVVLMVVSKVRRFVSALVAVGVVAATVAVVQVADTDAPARADGVSRATSQVSTAGTEFWFAFPPSGDWVASVAKSRRLFIAAEQDATVSVQVPGLRDDSGSMIFDTTISVAAGGLVEIDLFGDVSVSGKPLIDLPNRLDRNTANPAIDAVIDLGVHVISDTPVTVYGLVENDFLTDAFTALPVAALGQEYWVMGYSDFNLNVNIPPNGVAMSVIATVDNTTISVMTPIDTVSRSAKTPFDVTLNKGEVYVLGHFGGDLTGARVVANHPVGVISSGACVEIPNRVEACDTIVSMLTPVSTWGREFAAMNLAGRANSGSLLRVLAARNDTRVIIDHGDGDSEDLILQAGEFHETDLRRDTFSSVLTNRPVMVAQFATAGAASGNVGDPFMTLIPPSPQFLTGYTVGTAGERFVVGTDANHWVSLVTTEAGRSQVTLDGVTVAALTSDPWVQLTGSLYGVNVNLEDRPYRIETTGEPLGVSVYGFRLFESYGYPGGMALDPIVPEILSMDVASLTIAAAVIPEGIHSIDSDGDGISDWREINIYGTDPNNPDTDGDGFTDFEEIFTFESDPLLAGIGTPEFPYLIGLRETLEYLSDTVALWDGVNHLGSANHFRQTADIDMTGVAWTPIGNQTTQFSGVYDGGGRTISNVSITGVGDRIGLFGRTRDATVSSVTLNGFFADVTGESVGALIGQASGGLDVHDVQVLNTSISASVGKVGGLVGRLDPDTASSSARLSRIFIGSSVAVSGGSEVGGVVGQLNRGGPLSALPTVVAHHITTSATVTGTNKVGGVVGLAQIVNQNRGSEFASIRVDGSVTGTSGSVGGLFGEFFVSSSNSFDSDATVMDVVSTAHVEGGGGFVGGLIGDFFSNPSQNGTQNGFVLMHRVAAYGEVTSSAATVGGLIGRLRPWSGSITISEAVAFGDVGGVTEQVAGLIGLVHFPSSLEAEMQITDSYAWGSVVNSGDSSGGFIGEVRAGSTADLHQVTVENAYAIGALPDGDDVGGLIGKVSGEVDVTVSASFWDVQTSGTTVSAGSEVGIPTAQMQTLATFQAAGWDIANPGTSSTVWGIRSGCSYPYLMWLDAIPAPCPRQGGVIAPPPVADPAPSPSPSPAPVPVPVPVNGVLPSLQPGVSQVLVDGVPVSVEVFVEASTDLVLRGDGFELRLAGECSAGCSITTTADGRQVLELEERGLAKVSGEGFLAGTPVYVWLFSEPRFLGELTVNADGTFTGSVPLGDIAPGEHTLQVNGISFDGLPRTANLGVVVNALSAPTTLPATGSDPLGLWVLALALLGLGLILTVRRRPYLSA
jgi:hypothetical protein